MPEFDTDSDLIKEYKYGFFTDIETDTIPKGLNEEVIARISGKKNEPVWMLEWRLKAYRRWLKMKNPRWAYLDYPEIDFQNIHYYSAPKQNVDSTELDPELMKTFERLGIPMNERDALSGVAMDHFLFDFRGDSKASGTGEKISGHRGAARGQLLCGPQLRGV
jgi:Fe-S cluster assembly protein SufB